jgi:hypothetical protein
MNVLPTIRSRFRAGIFLATILIGGCGTNTVREHSDFAKGTRKVKTVGILPSEVEFVRLSAGGNSERIPSREGAIAQELFQGLKVQLEAKHYRVATLEVSVPVGQTVIEIQKLRMSYRDIVKQLYEKPMSEAESRQLRASVGTLAKPVADQMKVDAFLVSRYSGFEKSTGLVASNITSSAIFGAMTGVAIIQPTQGYLLEVALVDGATGDIFWINRENKRPVVRKEDITPGETGIASYAIRDLPVSP